MRPAETPPPASPSLKSSAAATRRAAGPALAALAAALLAACGGEREATVAGRAVDGPLQGATACLDLDDDGRCSATDPHSAPTDAEGRFVLSVSARRVGRHAVVVEVPAEAVDADTGEPVGRAFTLRAPATGEGRADDVFVSPLTTLVAAEMRASGVQSAVAAERVRKALGLGLSPLADFLAAAKAAPSDAARAEALRAARLARLVQLTALAQAAALEATLATAEPGFTAADAAREIETTQLLGLAAFARAFDDAGLAGDLAAAEAEPALRALATTLATGLGPDAGMLRWAGTSRRLAEPPRPAVPVATATLRSFSYTSRQAWQIRHLRSSAADNTPDGEGWVRYHDVYQASATNTAAPEGLMTAWTGNNAAVRAGDLHWNGSDWVACKLTDRYRSKLRDEFGRSEYEYCNGRETGNTVRRLEDISGLAMSDVAARRIRNFSAAYANWGPADLSLYGSATFPAGSVLILQNNLPTATAFSYDPRVVNQVSVFSAAVAAGGDARQTQALACADPAQNANAAMTPATSLEELIGRMPGTPCLFNQGGTAPDLSLSPNEWWGNSSVNYADRPGLNALPAGTGNHYNTTASIRVSFTGGASNVVTYHRCYRRAADGGPRNCSVIGRGRYSIQTLGDARVMSFSLPPALATGAGYQRTFVERGGRVYYGWKNPVGVSSQNLNLNLPAANAVLRQLGLPPIQVVTQPGTATGARATTLQTLQGTWTGTNGSDVAVWRFGPNGRFFMAEAKPFLANTREQSGSELGWFDVDPATGRMTTLVELDSNLTSGTSHPQLADETMSITVSADAITTSNGGTLTRLSNNPTGLVGLWALGSSTDLSVPHFVFLGNGRAMVILNETRCEANLAATDCTAGVEYASYTFNAANGTLVINNPVYDTNGCRGIFESCPSAVAAGTANTSATFTVTLASDGQTAELVDALGGGPIGTLYRIAPNGPTTTVAPNVAPVERDTHLFWDAAQAPTQNFNNAATLVVCGLDWQLSNNGTARTLIKIDPILVPTGARNVYLELFKVGSDNNFGSIIEARRALAGWGEADVTWNSWQATANPVDTLNVFGQVSVPPSTANEWVRIPITNLMKGWQQGTWPNHGLVLESRSGNPLSGCRTFNSNTAASNRPRVVWD